MTQTPEQLADLLTRAAARILSTSKGVRKDFDAHLLAAELGTAAHLLRKGESE